MMPGESKPRKPSQRKKRPTTREKVRQHLLDKNHVITDEDLREVIIGPEAVNLDAERQGHPGEKIENAAEEMQNEVPQNKKTTPWDVLSEE